MIPHKGLAMLGMLGMLAGGIGLSRAPSREQVLLMRLDRAEAAHLRKLASPEYHAAIAKRDRKRQRLLAR